MVLSRFMVIAGMIALAAASRLIPHPPNFTPIAAMALFGGAYLTSAGLALAVTLSAMFLSDLAIGFHPLVPVVYGSFALVVFLGRTLRPKPRLLGIVGAALASSILFFLLTNFGVWALGSMYPKTLGGLIACYVAAVPFFRNTVLGDAFYTVLLFGGFALAERRFALRQGPESAEKSR